MKRDQHRPLTSPYSLISCALLSALSVTALSVVASSSVHAEVPPITVGARYGIQETLDVSETSSVRDFTHNGVTVEVELLRDRPKQRRHLYVYTGWGRHSHTSNFYNGELNIERSTYDVGVSGSYQLLKWVKPYALLGVGVAFDELTLDYYSEPFISERGALLHANAQLGFEITIAGKPHKLKRPYVSVGARVLYDAHYVSSDEFRLKLEDAPPNLIETSLGAPPNLSHGASFAVFVQF